MPKFEEYPEKTSLDAADLIVTRDSVDGQTKHVRGDNLGLSGGGAPGSIDVGALLWEWDPSQGVAQFEATAITHQRDLGSPGGGNADTALALSTFAYGEPFKRNNNPTGLVLRVTATALEGGGYFPILASELTLPERFVLYVQYGDQNIGGNLSARFFICCNDDSNNFNGLSLRRSIGTADCIIEAIVNDIDGNARSFIGASSGTFDSLTVGGIQQLVGIVRPNGDTPSYSRGEMRDRGGSQDTQDFERALLHTISGVGTDWDGVDMNINPGPGAYEAINGSTGHIEYADIKVFAWPS